MRVETLVHRADLAAYSHSKQTPRVPEPPLTNVTPAEPLRGAERTTNHRARRFSKSSAQQERRLPPA